MTTAELVERVIRRITPRPPVDGIAALRTTLLVLVQDALRLLPTRVRERLGDADAEIYRKNFSVGLTAGQGSLASHTDLTSEPMIPSEIAKVTHTGAITDSNPTGKLQRVGSENLLSLSRSPEFSYFAVEDNTLYTMHEDDRTALSGSAVVRAAFVPLITAVKFSHESILIDCLVELAQGVKAA